MIRIFNLGTGERHIIVAFEESARSHFGLRIRPLAFSCFRYLHTADGFVEYLHRILPPQQIPVTMILEGQFDAAFVLNGLAEFVAGRRRDNRKLQTGTVAHQLQGIERRERIVAGSLVGAIGLIHRFGIVEQHLGIAVGHPVMLHLGALRQVEVVGQKLLR